MYVITGQLTADATPPFAKQQQVCIKCACEHTNYYAEVVVTDSVPLSSSQKVGNLTVLSVAPLMGEAIKRIHEGRSVGELFQ